MKAAPHTNPDTGTMQRRALSVVAEDFAGMRSQAFGLAERLGFPAKLTPIRPTGLMRMLPARMWPNPLAAVEAGAFATRGSDSSIIGPVLTVAGKGAAIGAALRRKGYTVVQIQHPRMKLDRFDLVVANVHDEIEGPNVLLGRTALHGLTPGRLEQARADWRVRLVRSGQPLLAALVGGSNGRFRFGRVEAEQLGASLARAARASGAHLFITTSRRTGAEGVAALREAAASVGGTVWSEGADNPYLGLVACADFLVVTTDSISMMSEAAASSAPLYIHDLPGSSRRIGIFVETLLKCGRARRFEGEVEGWPVEPLDDAPAIAREIRARLGLPTPENA
ncbi:mitochondrial fission ELM1 family protein [Acetobacter sacchari]